MRSPALPAKELIAGHAPLAEKQCLHFVASNAFEVDHWRHLHRENAIGRVATADHAKSVSLSSMAQAIATRHMATGSAREMHSMALMGGDCTTRGRM